MGLLQDLGEWFDDTSVGTWVDAVGSDFNRVRQSEQLDDILQDLHGDRPITGNQYYEKQKEYRDKFFEREAENENYTQAHNKLVRNDSFLQNIDQMGGTLEGMAAQAAGTLGGAVVGGLAAPFTAGASAVGGAKIGNAVGAVAGGYLDARSVAIQAREDVLDKGGSWEQAKKAYDEALFKASFTTLPETLLDIAMGNRIVSSAAKSIGKSAVGKVGSTLLDPASKVGTFVADKTRKSLIGRGAGLLTDVAMQGATEAVQEVTQDYIADREVAKAMRDADNEYSLGGFKDYMFSPQGLETMKTAGIMGALFGGAGGAISSGQYLKYATNDNAAMARINQLKDYNDKTGKLKIFSDKEAQDNFIQDVANIFNIDKEDIPSFRDALRMYINYDTEYWNVGIADRQVLNTAATNDLIQKLSGDASNRRDITSETTRDFFNFIGEDTAIDILDKYRADVLEKAKTEGQTETGTETTTEKGETTGESQPQPTIKATPGLGQQVAGQTNPQPYTQTRTETGQAEPSGTPQTTNTTTPQNAVFKQSIGKFNKTVEGKGNITYENGSRSIRLTQMSDGRFNVMDEHNLERGGKVFNTQEEAESFIQKIDEGTATWDDGTRFMGQSKNNAVVEQPNTSDGVISERHESDKQSGKKQIIHTADDLRKYFASRKGTPLQMDGRMYFEMMRAIERFGSENLGFNMAEGMGIVDGNVIPGKIDKIRDERGAVTGALITLYRGADAMTALHEIGHFGYWKMSEEEKQQFNEWAIKTESAFLARLLNRDYNQQFRNELIVALQTKQGDLWDRIQSEGVMYQTVDMLNNQRSSDLSQIACEERFAWEFSMWYAQGYTKGLQPNNFVQLILDRICGTLENALSLVSDTAKFLKSNGYENIQMGENVKSPLRMFEEMRTNDRPVTQQKQKTETEQPQEQPVEQPTQEPTQEQEETSLGERHVSAIEPEINTIEQSRFMYGSRGALNSPLNEIVSGKKTTREQQLEKDYTKLFYSLGKSLGYSQEYLDDIFDRYGRVSLNKIIDYKNNKKARVFKEINDTVNERIWKGTAKVKGVDFQRGLDGRWRFYFRDNLMHVKQGITKTLVTRPNDLIGRPMKLSDVIKHDILFKYYPTLKDIDVIFDTEKNDPELKDTYGWLDDKLNRIVINYDFLKNDIKEHTVNGRKYSSMDTNPLERTLLHELQHAIQGYEGLAMGGDEGDFTLVSSEYRNFTSMLRKKRKEFVDYIVKDSGFGFSEKAAESIVNQIFSDKNLRTRMDVLFKFRSPGFIEDELLFGFVQKDNLLFDRYYSLLGEIEARDAEKRKNMTEQRWREVAPNNGIGAYTNGFAPITVRDAYVSPAKTEQQRLDEQQAKQQQKPEQKKGERKPSIESVQGLINFAKAMGMSQEQIEQMIINESPNGKEIVEMMRNEQNKQKKKSDTRFMSIGKNAINSPVQNTFKLEMDYLRRYLKAGKQLGYSESSIHASYHLYGKYKKNKILEPSNKRSAEAFIKINDEVNNQLWKEGKSVQRGVDGRWRYYINDNNLTVSGDDKFWNGIKNVLQIREFPLASLIKHPELYKYYPDMKGTSVVFSDLLPKGVEASVMHISKGKVAIVVNYNSLQKNKSVDAKKKWFAKLMLHEMQHVVQEKEGFARGGSVTEFSYLPNENDRYRAYAQLLGEIEARDTSQRYGLTEEQWNRTKPLDYDFRYRQAVTSRGDIISLNVKSGENLRPSNSETRFQSSNRNLNQAKANKNDEFYTRMDDIQKELSNYKDQFKDKVIYCNCDDPQSSNFWKYFVDNFDSLGIKKVISTHYDANGSYKLEYDGQNTKRTDLQGDGDFRSQESLDTLKDADIVVSNPPFSLFRQYVKQLVDNDKQFLIVGNKNAMTSKEMFPLMKDGNVKLGNNNVHSFNTPDGQVKRFGNIGWFTNLATNKQTKEQEYTQRYYDDNGKPLPNVEQKYPKFDGTDIINVNRVADIPVDYDGVMGVPISFMDNYTESSPFEIVGTVNHGTDGEWDLAKSMVGGKEKFKRIAIKKKENKDKISDKQYKAAADSLTRFMAISVNRGGLGNSKQLEKQFHREMIKLGISDGTYQKFKNPDKIILYTAKDKEAKRFIFALNEINKKMWDNGNIYRGLDGKWRYWIDDRYANVQSNILNFLDNLTDIDLNSLDREELEEAGLGEVNFLDDVLKYDELFKYYPELKNTKVIFSIPYLDSELSGASGYYANNTIVINVEDLYGYRNLKERDRRSVLQTRIMGTLLHEVQHNIQDNEGFARGFNSNSFISRVASDNVYANEVAQIIYDNREEIKAENSRGSNLSYLDLDKKVAIDLIKNILSIRNSPRSMELLSIIRETDIPKEFYYRSLGEEEARFVGDNWSNNVIDDVYYIGDEKLNQQDYFCVGYEDTDGEYHFISLNDNAKKLKQDLLKAIKYNKRLLMDIEKDKVGTERERKTMESVKSRIQDELNSAQYLLDKLKQGEKITKKEEYTRPEMPMSNEDFYQDLMSENGDYVHIDTRFQSSGNKKLDNAIKKEIEKADNILDRKSTGDTRFMGCGGGCKNSILDDPIFVSKVDKKYKDLLKQYGLSDATIKEYTQPLNQMFGTFTKETLEFIRSHNKANDVLWEQDGVYRGLDGQWRFWVSDKNATVDMQKLDAGMTSVIKGRVHRQKYELQDILQHDELFKHYDDTVALGYDSNRQKVYLPKMLFYLKDLGSEGNIGEHDNNNKTITLNPYAFYKDDNGVYRIKSAFARRGIKRSDGSVITFNEEDTFVSVILHEVQHEIQRYEGFARGGNPSYAKMIENNEIEMFAKYFNSKQDDIKEQLLKNDNKLQMLASISRRKPPLKTPGMTQQEYYNKVVKPWLDKVLDFFNDDKKLYQAIEDSEYSSRTTNGKIISFLERGGIEGFYFNKYQRFLGEIEARDTAERYEDEQREKEVPFKSELEYSRLENDETGGYAIIRGLRKGKADNGSVQLRTEKERQEAKDDIIKNRKINPRDYASTASGRRAIPVFDEILNNIADGKIQNQDLSQFLMSFGDQSNWRARRGLKIFIEKAIQKGNQYINNMNKEFESLLKDIRGIAESTTALTPNERDDYANQINDILNKANVTPVVPTNTTPTTSPTTTPKQQPTVKKGRQVGGTQKKPTVLTPKQPGKVAKPIPKQQPQTQPATTPQQPVKKGLTAAEKQKKKEATAEETKKKVIEARKKGEVTDIYKDVYSVSFDKSAQSNEENQRKMRYFEQRLNFWDKTVDKDGKITYTRKVPYQSHQKIINYSGINGIEKLNKPKKKWEEWKDWAKDTLIKYLFNDKHYLAKVARKYDMWDTYVKLVVMKDYSLRANVALTEGIMYNGKRTRALNDIIKEIGEEDQKDFIDYCIAFRIDDLSHHKYWEKKPKLNAKGEYEKDTNGNIVWEEVELTKEILQKMSKKEAKEIIDRVKSSNKADLFERNRKDFVKYNHALLHVLVDGGIMSEDRFNKFVESDPNFVPLSKVMDDTDFSFNAIVNANSLVNINTPIKKIGTSMREVANPFMEMQKRTAEYYSISARNRAGQIFVNEIAGKIDYLASGDVVQRGQGLLRKVKVDQRDGKLLTRPSDRDQIIYVCNNGEHEFYQIADKEIYLALKSLDADQMGTIQKMLDKVAHVPSGLVRNTATMVPDFGFRNLFRDNVEAFLTSEHGFIPFVDAIWGMYQMANNTEWYQRYLEQNGEYGTLNRDNGRVDDIARIEDIIEDKINPLRNWNEIRKANMAVMRDTKKTWIDMKNIKSGDFGKAWENTRNGRLFSLMKLAVSPVWAIGKSNKRLNDYLEIGTRIGEFKNAKMGYSGLLDRLAKVGVDTNLANAVMNDIYAAGVSKDITLNFGQHGVLGKALNRYIPFFNASLQGIYKLLNTWDLMLTGTTMSGKKNRSLQAELIFKTALISAFAIGIAAAGEGDEDYEEAPDYERENFWIFPNGIRIPKDQVLGKMIGNSVEKSYSQWKKGKAEPLDIIKNIAESFAPDKIMPAIFDMAIGGLGNYDTFYKQAIVPEYMADKLGYLQKDIRTSNFSADVTEALWKTFGINVSAKKLDWAIQKQLTNLGKYLTTVYDAGKQGFNPKDFNERIARGYDKNDSTGAFVGGLKDDVWKPLNLITGTFATNRTQYKSISDFYANYNKYKKLSSDEERMTPEQKKAWKRYQEAYKKDKVFRKELRAIKSNKAFSGKEKRERADKIFKQQIKLAKWAEG